MRVKAQSLTGPSLTGGLPQSIIEVPKGGTLLVLGIGAAVFIIVLLLLIVIQRRRRNVQSAAAPVEAHSIENVMEAVKLDDLVVMGTNLYEKLGHTVRDVISPSRDVADLIIDAQTGERWIARCLAKPTINSQEVAAFNKAISKASIPQSALITNGSFTAEAMEEAERGAINTLDLHQLTEYLSKVKQIPE